MTAEGQQPFVIAGDWGTSSLRLWLLSASGEVLAEARSAEGMDKVQAIGFETVLRQRIADLGPAVAMLPSPLPVVLCGMVGARQGWQEAGYLDVPVHLSAVADKATRVAADGLDVRILPGICRRDPGRPDVMRGEETQLLGLILDDPATSGTVCMPGTHCKWVQLDGGRVTDFSTYLTGEFFALMAGNSILRHSVRGHAPSGDVASPAFAAGLAAGLAAPAQLAGNLFSIRAHDLLFGAGDIAAADRLSGLLIGAEVGAAIGNAPAGPIHLVAGGALAGLYGAAIVAAGREAILIDADGAVRPGLLHAARLMWPALAGRAE